MPGALLITLVSWLASHLIVLTLLAFAFVGVVLYHSEDMADSAVTAEQPPADLEHHRSDDPDPSAATGSAEQAAARPQPASAPESAPKQARQPKLIGGSLPVYQRMPGEAATGAFDAAGGFRPPEAVPPPPAQPGTYETRIQAARRAYWNGEFELAETHYVDLVTAYPDDADAFGELGNLYEAMGEWQLAKDAYFAAGERLKQAGDTEKLGHVIDLLEKKGDSRAQRLRQP